MNIKKGDNVIVTKGKDKGQKAKVVSISKTNNRVFLDGLNMKKRHKRAATKDAKGTVTEIYHSVARANVALLDPKSGKATRIKSKEINGKKVRVASKSGQEI